MALAAAQIQREQLGCFRKQGVEGGAVALRQVHHVDVVTHATATWHKMGNRLLGIPLGWASTAGGK